MCISRSPLSDEVWEKLLQQVRSDPDGWWAETKRVIVDTHDEELVHNPGFGPLSALLEARPGWLSKLAHEARSGVSNRYALQRLFRPTKSSSIGRLEDIGFALAPERDVARRRLGHPLAAEQAGGDVEVALQCVGERRLRLWGVALPLEGEHGPGVGQEARLSPA